MRHLPAAVLLLAVAGALTCWLALRTDPAPPPAPDRPTITANPAAQPLDAAVSKSSDRPDDEPDEPAPLRRVQAPTDPLARKPAANEAAFRGRCVDPNGNPIAGVTVDLSGWGASAERMEAHRREHGEIDWRAPEAVVTATDGRFALFFEPPPPYTFSLELTHPGFATISGRWHDLAPGDDNDLGDVVLPLGAVVTGRVVDVDGVPQERVTVNLDHRDRQGLRRTGLHPTSRGRARTAADGTFAMRQPLLPATWDLSLRDAQLAEPKEEVVIAAPTTWLELVVKRASDVPAIRGIVVDQRGEPVRGARIEPVARRGSGRLTSSQRDGTFTLVRRESGDPTGEFALSIECTGYEPFTSEPRYRWGMRDVRLALQTGIDVHVFVRRADDGNPVEEFALRVIPKPGTTGRWSSREARARSGWQHEGGRAIAKGLRRGAHLIVVEPRAKSDLVSSSPVEVEVRDGPSPTVTIALSTFTEQTVRVVHGDGKAAAGSKVELLAPVDGAELTASTPAHIPMSYRWLHPGTATLVDEAETDAAGTCTLRGAGDRAFALRVTGKAHATLLLPNVRLGADVLECVLPTGAGLRVTLRPLELLGDLREQAMLPRTGPIEGGDRTRPGIRLHRQIGEQTETVPISSKPPARFDDQGVAVLQGVPAGTWDVLLESSKAIRERAWTTGNEVVRTGVTLREGDEAAIELDLSVARRARLSGTVTLAGEPFKGRIQLQGVVGVQPDGNPKIDTRSASTDEHGAFSVLLAAGTWKVGAQVRVGNESFTAWSDARVRTVAGQDSTAGFDTRIASVQVRVLAPDGKPATGVRVMLQRNGETLHATRQPTDAEGRATITSTPGTATPRVLIRSLLDRERLRAYSREHAGDPAAYERMLVTLPPIAITESGQNEIEIRLPAEWDR